MSIKAKLIDLILRCSDESLDVDIVDDTNLMIDLSYSSINLIELIVEIEGEFDIEIPDEDLNIERLSNFKELLNIVKDAVGIREKNEYER